MAVPAEYTEMMNYLDIINTSNWINIPAPVTDFLTTIRRILKFQSQFILSHHYSIPRLEETIDHKVKKLRNKITMPSEILGMIDKKLEEMSQIINQNVKAKSKKFKERLGGLDSEVQAKFKQESDVTKQTFSAFENMMKNRIALINIAIESSKDSLKDEFENRLIPSVMNSKLKELHEKNEA